jgi:hypothetical protein
MPYVFADYAGHVNDPNEEVVVLASVVASEVQMDEINARFNRLKEKISQSQWGIDTHNDDFEFASHDLVSGSGLWRPVARADRREVSRALLAMVTDLKLPFFVIVLDLYKGAKSGLNQLNADIRRWGAEADKDLPPGTRTLLETYLRSHKASRPLGGSKGLTDVTSVLWGCTSGLMQEAGLVGDAEVIVDEQFVRNVDGWNTSFNLMAELFAVTGRLDLFPTWRRSDQPGWHLGRDVSEVKSYSSHGVQLADYVAYITGHQWKHKRRGYPDILKLDIGRFVRWVDYQGFYLGCSDLKLRRRLQSRRRPTDKWMRQQKRKAGKIVRRYPR